MKKEDVERTIKDGVENAAASIVSDEIANAIMSGDLQKDELSVSKDDDKHQDMQNEEKSSDKQESSDQGKSQDDIDEQKQQNLGKFKNPQELLRAYGELEKEFTRKSQKLKELESGVDKNEEMNEQKWKEAADKFFSANPERKTVCPRNRKQNHARAVFEKGRKLFQRGSDAGFDRQIPHARATDARRTILDRLRAFKRRCKEQSDRTIPSLFERRTAAKNLG